MTGAPVTRELTAYFAELARLMAATSCTDAAGAELGPDAGFRRAVELLVARARGGGTLMFVGNGGSAAIAGHAATDFFRVPGVRATAFNDPTLLTCLGNDCGYEQVFAQPVGLVARPGDALVAVSSSGRSPSILNAVAAARERGCAVVTLSGFAADNPLRGRGDVNFHVPSPAYGPVETVHAAICHALFEGFAERWRG